MITRRKWYTHDFLAESQKLLKRAPTSKDAGLAPPVEGLSNICKYPGHGYRLLRKQSSQPGPQLNRRGLHKEDSSYGPRGGSLGRRGQASVPANLPDHLVQFIALDMLYALRTSALKCAGAPSCWNHLRAFKLAGTLCSRT
ncbi:uncharacterized protein TNCV_4360041 [Trichonephila clavipes]|uniref:Uncharacterized protein n=1 Tax=Trichonephila clavipes TaxID=2585209 RepID=A0A8X7BI14_TRICX|nr:uncharacterized protein TNCV_4360041 [Trichonephila clavipes]